MGEMLTRHIEMVAIDRITVTNSRARNRRIHREIVENIDAVGLKRPITISRRTSTDGRERFELVCGEGRLEAFRALGQSEIPAIIVDASEHDCLVMGLVENLARRQHRPIDLLKEVGSLRHRGYSDAEIGAKIGVTAAWVNMIAGLLERGEERLVAAVETGLLPISFAVEISRSDDAETQRALADAYTQGKIKGKKLGIIRRLLEARARSGKGVAQNPYGRKGPTKRILTPEELMRIYRREADRQIVLVKKSNFVQERLLFIGATWKELRQAASQAILSTSLPPALPIPKTLRVRRATTRPSATGTYRPPT